MRIMKYLLAIIVFLFLLPKVNLYASDEIELSDFSLHDYDRDIHLSIGANTKFILKKLGKLYSKELDGTDLYRFIYDDLVIVSTKDLKFIMSFWTNSPSFVTKRGIRVGDNIAEVYDAYGNPRNDYGDHVNYVHEYYDSSLWIVVTMFYEDSIVNKIKVYVHH